jgi:hypothetical protein
MNDREQAIAVRDRIGRLYGFTGSYGTANPEPDVADNSESDLTSGEPSATISVEEVGTETELEEENAMIFNRFKVDSVAGRMLKALAAGPKTAAQLAHIAGSKSADNILAPGGWFYQLRKFGKTSGKFKLEKSENRLVLTISKRYASQV